MFMIEDDKNLDDIITFVAVSTLYYIVLQMFMMEDDKNLDGIITFDEFKDSMFKAFLGRL